MAKEKTSKQKTCEFKTCPECGSQNISCDEKTQQLICKSCGLIYEEMTPKTEKQFKKAEELK